MARPKYTVVMKLNGSFEIMEVANVPFKCKGTSFVRAGRILEALDNE